jgi:uncharacterized membrane protein (UPF0127 family)
MRIDRTCRPVGLVTGQRFAAPLVAVVADGPVTRAIGVLGTPDLRLDEALILLPCSSVHGVGLRCSIGVAFVDAAGAVMRVVDPLPWWGARVRGAHAVVEARSGVLASLRPGDTISVDDDHVFPLRGNSASQ